MSRSVASSLLENALDYFLSAAENARKDDVRSLKYSVLHIAASVELALKARLFMEHWSLIFADVDKADEAALKRGDFKSAEFQTVVDRLAKIAKVPVSKEDLAHLGELRRLRNCIQHFALRITKPQASSLVAKNANFLIDFCNREFPNALAKFRGSMRKIKQQLKKFGEYVAIRLESIKPKLDKAAHVFRCPECWQRTVIFVSGDWICLFCGFHIDPTELANNITEGGVTECPDCGEETLAFCLMTNEDGYDLCTSCGFEEEWHSSCPRCGELNITGPLCEDCMAESGEKD